MGVVSSLTRKIASAARKAKKSAEAAEKANQKKLGGKGVTRGKPKDTPAAAESDRAAAVTKNKQRANRNAAALVEKKGSIATKAPVSKTAIREAKDIRMVDTYIRKLNGMPDGLIKKSSLAMAKARRKQLRDRQASDADRAGRKSSQANRDRSKNTKEKVSLKPMPFSRGGTPVFKTCKDCPTPAKCKAAGKCLGKKKK